VNSRERTLKVDTEDPIIDDVSLSPADGDTFSSRYVTFNVELSERVKELYYFDEDLNRKRTLCRNCQYYGPRRLRFSAESDHEITFHATDYAGNEADPIESFFSLI